MNKRSLETMVDNPALVPGIYNYCDRWCERCTHGTRCLTFQMEQAEAGQLPPEAHDVNNAAFWQRIGAAFALAREMIDEYLKREGITLTEEDLAAAAAQQRLDRVRVKKHPCCRAAHDYIGMVDAWFSTGAAAWRAVAKELEQAVELRLPGRAPRQEGDDLCAAVEVIRFYQYFLYPKIGRALGGRLDGDEFGDAAGSAKIALIAMDRSLGAWSQLLAHFPEREAATLPLLIHLEKLRRAVENTFPKARAYLRPGLDEP
jgi:hypothetical protein